MEPLTPERRRQLTREHLLHAAAQVFAERGFAGASLDEVAARAGFSKGAVYSNFRNKEDLFLALLGWRYAREWEALAETLQSGDTPSDVRLSDFVELVRRQGATEDGDWWLLYEEFHLYALRNPAAKEKLAELEQRDVDEITRVIEGERQRLGLRSLQSAPSAARTAVAFMRGIAMMRALDPQGAGDDFLEAAMAFLARGLLTEPEAD